MHQTQRGSVLVSIIIGIVILAVIGVGAVSIMTSSTMSSIAGRETMQATYLAESGRGIVIAESGSKKSAALMTAAQELNTTFTIADKGSVKLTMTPYWFRTNNATPPRLVAATPAFAAQLRGERALLAISNAGVARLGYDFTTSNVKDEGTLPANADVYLVGRCASASLSGDANTAPGATLTVSPESGTDDFTFFPEIGGMLGLVDKTTTTVSKRLIYAKRQLNANGSATFSGLRTTSRDISLSGDDVKNHDLALGQYFRVVSEAKTTNGALAASVWGTNGKGSFAFGDSETGGTTSGVVGGAGSLSGNKKDDTYANIENIFGGTHKNNGETITGDNITGDLQVKNDLLQGSTFTMLCDPTQKSVINHFLKKGTSNDKWFSAIALQAPESGNETTIQVAMLPQDKQNNNKNGYFFSGILFNLEKVTSGAKGLGIGIASCKMTLNDPLPGIDLWYKVSASSINPLLMPGFWYETIFLSTSYRITSDDIAQYYFSRLGTFANKLLTSKLLVILWEYDDSQASDAISWLGVSALNKPTSLSGYERLAVRVQKKDGKNTIQAWVGGPAMGQPLIWPQQGKTSSFTPVVWHFSNSGASISGDTLTTSLATGEQNRKVGVFAEAFGTNGIYPPTAVFMRDFAFTTPGSELDNPGGLTPGIVE